LKNKSTRTAVRNTKQERKI